MRLVFELFLILLSGWLIPTGCYALFRIVRVSKRKATK
jgi:hypothetical protein